MKRTPFHDREKETKEIRDILDAEPSLITFVYGPINSGKTTLITHLIEELSDDYVVFYINLRTKFLASYDDFIESLFEMEMETGRTAKKGKEALAELISSATKITGIPITREFIDYVFKDNKPKNAFSYMLKLFEEVKKSGKHPVLVLDELQKIGDVKVNGPLIYELFNFFIDLTKEKHLAHVFVATSDSLFIEQVYSKAMLSGRSEYLLVDDFDEKTTTEFLERYGFTDDETRVAWDYCGGKPVFLLKLIRADEKEGIAKKMLATRVNQLKDLFDYLDYTKPRIMIGEDEYRVEKDDVVSILKRFVDAECIGDEGLDRPAKHFLIKDNILFLDPEIGIIKPQSQLNLLAIREVMRNA
ncbi:MAG: putative ATP-binding protein [Candidatus Argoarchaeum ethanivorans]|uniref:Putative ATP-binding protein n=1 Tax=Candidatus Argoarchaeum ethanivorans TaxID=2608793 RepID=A0A811T5R7_9EURY|nr:MAG: putative ATP-binding protein [Candidatus Argoarchaeum ethanivorans]